MYAWIWRRLPFGLPGKLSGSVLIAAAVVALLWYVVFPWAEQLLPFDHGQVTQDSGNPGAPAPGGPGVHGATPGPGEHDLPYATHDNNTPPPTRNR
jgi:hypothetical protein